MGRLSYVFWLRSSSQCSKRASASCAELIQDWALWAVVAFTRIDQAAQRVNDRPMCFHTGRDCLLVAFGQDANLTARSLRIAPKPQQLIDLLDRRSQENGRA